jgi:hypothetical protein
MTSGWVRILLESCVQPHPEQAYPAVDIAGSPALDEQLSLVDETHRRNAVLAHRVTS